MTRTETLHPTGMSCQHCVRAVREALEGVAGVTVEDVEIGSARVTYDDDAVAADDLRRAVEREGYPLAG